jgi:hypothetical protein
VWVEAKKKRRREEVETNLLLCLFPHPHSFVRTSF